MNKILIAFVFIVSTVNIVATTTFNLPKFDSIEINSPNIISALDELQTKLKVIYEPRGHTPLIRVFDLSDGKEKRIAYSGINKTVPEVVEALLKLNQTDYYYSDREIIWLGITEKRVKKVESKYPNYLGDIILPKVVFEDMSISEVEEILGKLWLVYNPAGESAEWRMNTGRQSESEINLTCKQVDFLSIVSYLDIITDREPGGTGQSH
jgi:hypothetical protein